MTLPKSKMVKFFKIILVASLIVIAYLIGKNKNPEDTNPEISQLVPGVKKTTRVNDNIYLAFKTENINACPEYIIAFSSSQGYAGPIQLAVIYDLKGNIADIEILKHSETPAFFRRVMDSNIIDRLSNIKYNDSVNKDEISTITGATFTSQGIINAVKNANAEVQSNIFNEDVPKCMRSISFGYKESCLIILFIVSIFIYFGNLPLKTRKILRIFTQIAASLLLGVFYGELLSITHFNTLLLGFFPVNQIYWYLILGVFIIPVLFLGINIYYLNICPFGALQDLLGKLPVKKYRHNNIYTRKITNFLPVVLTIAIISYALITRQPGYIGHEIFSAVFQFEGHIFHFILAGVIILAAVFIKRPWCRYLCPVGVVGRFLNLLRSLFKG